MESFINKFTNKYISVVTAYLKSGVLEIKGNYLETLLYTKQQPRQSKLLHANSIVFATFVQ